jgi:hypothetical protein
MRINRSISSNQTTIIPKYLVVSHTYNLKQIFKYIETNLNDSISLVNKPFAKSNFYISPSLRVKFVDNQIDESAALYISSAKKLFLMDSFGTRLYAKFKDINFNLDQLPTLLDKLSLERTHSQEGDYFFITRDWQGNPLPIYANNGDINTSSLDRETTASLKLSLRYIYNNISFALNSSSAKYMPDNFTLPINSTSFNLINLNTTKEQDSPPSQGLFDDFKIDAKFLYLGGAFIGALGLAYTYYNSYHQRANRLEQNLATTIITELSNPKHISEENSFDVAAAQNLVHEDSSNELKHELTAEAEPQKSSIQSPLEENDPFTDCLTASSSSKTSTPNKDEQVEDRLTPITTSFSSSDLGPDSAQITSLNSGVQVTPIVRQESDFVAIAEDSILAPNSYGSYEFVSPTKPEFTSPQAKNSKEAIDKAISKLKKNHYPYKDYLKEFDLILDNTNMIYLTSIDKDKIPRLFDQTLNNKNIINMYGANGGFHDIYKSYKETQNQKTIDSLKLPELTKENIEYIFIESKDIKQAYIRYVVKAMTILIAANAASSIPGAEAIDLNAVFDNFETIDKSKKVDLIATKLISSAYEKISEYAETAKVISKSIICRGISYSVATFTYDKTSIIDGKTKAIDLTTNALCNYAIDLATNFKLPSSKTIVKDTKEVAVATTCYEISNRLAENSDDHATKFAIYMTTPSICNLIIEGSDKALEMVGEITSL